MRWGSVVAVLAGESGARRKVVHHPSRPALAGRPCASARRAGGARGASLRVRSRPPDRIRIEEGGRSVAVRDAQAGVPSAGWPRAQLAFKDSMVRGILQFTPGIAFRYVLHRCESRDIRCRESLRATAQVGGSRGGGSAAGWTPGASAPPRSPTCFPWRCPRRGFFLRGGRASPSGRGGWLDGSRSSVLGIRQ